MNPDPSGRGVARDILLILFLACVLLLPSMWTRDLWNPDEPRYMAVGWGMLQTGDFLVPHLSGNIYPDKPPLFFWLAAFFYRLGFGLNGGRVVAALATAGTILVTYFLARRRIGKRAGLTAALVTMTLMFFLATSKMGVIDPLVTFLMVSTIACGLRAMEPETHARRRWWLAAYALTGLAVLTKGPVGIVVPLIVLASYGIAMRKKVRPGGWVHLAGVFLMVNVVGWWLVPALVAGGGEYANEIVFSQTAKRLVKSPSHEAPFYQYLMLLPGILFPWSLLLVPAGWSAWKAWRRDREPAAALGVTWFLGIFLFFSAVSGKRVGYILPIAPAVGLLVARYLCSAERAGELVWPRLYRMLSRITLAGIGIAMVLSLISGFVAGPVTGLLHPGQAELQAEVAGLAKGAPLALALPTAAVLVLVIYGWRRAVERPAALAVVLVLLIAVTSVAVDLALLPRANSIKSGLNFAKAVGPYLRRADKVYLFKNDFSGVYNIYTGRVSIPVLRRTRRISDELDRALAAPERVAVIGRDTDFEKELGRPPEIGREAVRVRVGHRNVVLIVNWPETEDP